MNIHFSMLKSSKIVFILVLVMSLIYYGIMKVNFILEAGEHFKMVKVKNQVKVFSSFLVNIDLKDILLMGKEMGMGY